MKFCPECGTQLPVPNPKFCPECGAKLQAPSASVDDVSLDSIPPQPKSGEASEDDEFPQVKLNTYELGVNLEDMTAAIFQRMGYSVEKRKRMPTKSGATAEIDIMIQRGARRKAVECKNYDPSRSVGVSDLRVFSHKLMETRVFAGVFVTNTSFSEDSEKLAESTGIDLWNGDILREKYFTYQLGRIRDPSLVRDPILPLEMDFATASSHTLRNSHLVTLINSRLLYHPYIQVKYRLQAKRSDPTRKSHSIRDSGTYYVDAMDGDIINKEKSAVEIIGVLLKKKEERLQSRESKMISEDLEKKTPVTRPVLEPPEYKVSVAEPEVTEKDAVKIIQAHVVAKNTQTIKYQVKVRGEMETRPLKVVPRKNEVSVRGTKLIYVPKWDLEFEALQSSFSRRILASSGRMLVDGLAKCTKCTLLRKPGVAVCEECGRLLCDKHAYQEGRWLCEDHISDAMREQVKGTRILPRLMRRRA